MQVFHSKAEARHWVRSHTCKGHRVGLVPTMGALHDGHFSLVRRSQQRCDATAVTIFVNPTQFAPHEDLNRYPRTLDADLAGLRACGADAVFVPAADAMYRPEHSTFIEPPHVARPLEGAARPDHFRGVATVVLKLLQILPATHAFFGQKDFQQAAVIRAMVLDLDIPVEVEVCEIIRDPDGLAMSSRNRYLSGEQRARALSLWQALRAAEQALRDGEQDAAAIESRMRRVLSDAPVDRIEYAVVADPMTLESVRFVQGPCVALVAARVGDTRLIDNHMIQPPAG